MRYLPRFHLCVFIAICFVANVVDAYTPSNYVTFGHKFSNSKIDLSQSYAQKVLLVPAILCALGILSIIALNLGLLSRCCFQASKCLPKMKGGYTKEYADKMMSHKKTIFIVFFVLCFFVIAVDQIIFYGGSKLDSGINNAKDSLNSVKDIFVRVDNDGNTLSSYGKHLSTLSSLNCNNGGFQTSLKSYISKYNSAVSSLTSVSHPLVTNANFVRDQIDSTVSAYGDYALYGVYAIAIISTIIFLLFHCCKTKGGMIFAIIWGQVSFVVIVVLSTIWLIITAFLADLCVDPVASIQNIAPSGTVSNITQYYATCEGSNFLYQYTANAKSYAYQLNSSLALAISNPAVCPNKTALVNMQAYAGKILYSITDIETAFACPSIRTLWLHFLDDGVCGDLYLGIFSMWVSQLVTSFLLFVLIVVAAIMYQHYGKVVPYDGDEEINAGVEPHPVANDSPNLV